jgi:hypothetical protein
MLREYRYPSRCSKLHQTFSKLLLGFCIHCIRSLKYIQFLFASRDKPPKNCFLHKPITGKNYHIQSLVRWCSWLSRQSNTVSTLKVSSSSLGRIKGRKSFFGVVVGLGHGVGVKRSPLAMDGLPIGYFFVLFERRRPLQFDTSSHYSNLCA